MNGHCITSGFFRIRGSLMGLLFVSAMLASTTFAAGAREMSLSSGTLLDSGVSLELARTRAGSIGDVSYRLFFSVRDGEGIRGRLRLSFDFDPAPGVPLVIDFAGRSVDSVALNGDEVSYGFRDEHIVIMSRFCREGRNVVEVTFQPDERPFHREKDYMYTLFVPDRARFAFPCFDQPDLKARFSLSLEVPRGWIAVSNSELVSETAGEGASVFTFGPTPPLSTYLFSFVAGRFESIGSSRNGRELRMYYLPENSRDVERNAEDIFELHFRALDWLERFTAVEYPFGKFEFVLIPSFPYSGMEHPGAVCYRSERLLLAEKPTGMELLRRANVISHETSHMWFGDLVTMRWFDDVWLKEAFAQFMADKIVRPSFPGIDHRLIFFSSHMDALYEVERSRGTHPIKQDLGNLAEAGSLYGNIIYHKPPVMLNQLEMIMGADSLRSALREYLSTYAFSNATWSDLVEILDRHSGEDILDWSRVWVEERGRPEFSMVLKRGEGGVVEGLTVRQEDPLGRGLVWPEKFHVLLGGSGGSNPMIYTCAEVTEVDSFSGAAAGVVLLDSRGEGFGLFRLDRSVVSDCCSYDFLESIERAVYSFELWDNLLEGAAIGADDYAEYLLDLFGKERNELVIQSNLARFELFFWNFLPDEVRIEWGSRFERLFIGKMREALPPSVKRAYFKTFIRTVISSEGVDTLMNVWKGETAFPGLSFSSKDHYDMALELVVRGVPQWHEILSEQLRRFAEGELKERFAFVARAASPMPEDRDDFFESLAAVESRRHEPWVLDGIYYLHHPLRRLESVRYIEKSLEMLEEIERTGDIFFPKEWIKATMRYHDSEDALLVVQRFLREHPGFPERLKRIVFQATDVVERARRYEVKRGRD